MIDSDPTPALLERIWLSYANAWKVTSVEEKMVCIEESLDQECVYTDPLKTTVGWDSLIDYMLYFHKQIPGGHFKTTYFLAHHQQCISQWEMCDAENRTMGTGISYGKFNDRHKLYAITGFFETEKS